MIPDRNERWKAAFVDMVKKMSSVRRIVTSSEEKKAENRGWEETEDEYRKRQAEWLEKMGEKKKKKAGQPRF
ncbi:hypothetical protein OOT00_03215 [Desulfobotulus sp. H1]|uniref:Uncharacterized protein n=1 Tax=Desulfobotulus pelophilus TaxID=2823377 RepID=A0ABT3N6A7_9BACT|nr:hypothetical protein [Desulfobotulus pelophilus]MCW7752991.1 hypothetical protein [Desulfobotulus pelophilus]